MDTIRLARNAWQYDEEEPLGPRGGFGAVFRGVSPDGLPVAVKRLHLDASSAAHRELAIADVLVGARHEHVVPVLDAGLDPASDRYFIVMALADGSLQDRIDKGPLQEADALPVLLAIVSGLRELRDVVHRDLKPANVLRVDDGWRIADFGISRFVEKATSARTLKSCLTAEYAAPEQWQYERATHATDVYALGCIAHALVEGNPPFSSGEVRERHLHEEPPRVSGSPRFQQLVSMCLRKNPSSRPPLEALARQLSGLLETTSMSPAVAAAAAAVARKQAETDAREARARSRASHRRQLARDGLDSLRLIVDQLFDAITSDASVAVPDSAGGSRSITLGAGTLTIETCFPYLEPSVFPGWKKDIVCGALVAVQQTTDAYGGRSANLWFGDLDGSYRWWEVDYFTMFGPREILREPFGVRESRRFRDVDLASCPVTHAVSRANRPRPIDGESIDDFVKRWSERLASAATNTLRLPRCLPESR